MVPSSPSHSFPGSEPCPWCGAPRRPRRIATRRRPDGPGFFIPFIPRVHRAAALSHPGRRRPRRIAMGMTDSKEPSETGTTASETDDAKKKPYVPIADRPPAGRAGGRGPYRGAGQDHPRPGTQRPAEGAHGGQHDHAHPPRRPGRLARRAARLARIRKPHLRPIVDEVGFFRTP